jgi:hypothetical protein
MSGCAQAAAEHSFVEFWMTLTGEDADPSHSHVLAGRPNAAQILQVHRLVLQESASAMVLYVCVNRLCYPPEYSRQSCKRTPSGSCKPPDPVKPYTLRTCTVSGEEFGCMRARPSPQ